MLMRTGSGLRGATISKALPSASPIAQLDSLVKSLGGSWWLPGVSNRVSSDGSGGVSTLGDVIGYQKDRGIGDFPMSQATTSAKPTLQQDSGGKYYLQHSGTTALTSTLNATGSYYLASVTIPASTNNMSGLSSNNGANNAGLFISATNLNTAYCRDTGNASATLTKSNALNVKHIYEGWRSMGVMVGVALDGTELEVSGATAVPGSSCYVTQGRANGVWSYMVGGMYAALYLPIYPNEAQRLKIRRLLAKITGVTL